MGRRHFAVVGCCMALAGCFANPAPQVVFTTLSGQTLGPADCQGQVMLVNFWATSCTTCVAEMPAMADTYNQFKSQGLKMVAVAMAYDRPDYVVNFATTRKLPFDVALDVNGSIAKAYGEVQITPTTFLINKQGEVVKTWVGSPDFAVLRKLVQEELNLPSPF
ncbi:MAG: TlpA family protein disulfide reductase [Limnobacter sp.]|nr:TlpA family protein disulfide reductase [Limnobacter sp.]